MRSSPPRQALARRQLLKASLAGGVLAGALPRSDPGAAAAIPESWKVTAHDVRRIAAVLYGTTLAAADAEKIARTAAGTLANLHYLTLLKSDDVQPPFDYAAMVEEASRP